MTLHSRLASERGSSVVEFLICAPLLALLTYGAYDMNRRIENQQTVTIAARNAVLMGNAFSETQHKTEIKAQLGVEGQILDHVERQQVMNSLFVSVEGGKKLGQGVSADRIAAPSGFKTDSTGFDGFSQKSGDVGQTLAEWLQDVQDWGEKGDVLIADGIRTAGVETDAAGMSNAIQGALGILADATTNRSDSKTEALAVRRRFGQRFYLREASGYHPNDHERFDYAGIFMGSARKSWGGDDSFGDQASRVGARCMTRLYGSDKCGNGGDHDFHDHVKTVATAKMTISTILHVLEKIPWTAAFASGAIKIIQGVTGAALAAADAAVTGVGAVGTATQAFDAGTSGAASLVTKISTTKIGTDFSGNLDPASVQKKIGE